MPKRDMVPKSCGNNTYCSLTSALLSQVGGGIFVCHDGTAPFEGRGRGGGCHLATVPWEQGT